MLSPFEYASYLALLESLSSYTHCLYYAPPHPSHHPQIVPKGTSGHWLTVSSSHVLSKEMSACPRRVWVMSKHMADVFQDALCSCPAVHGPRDPEGGSNCVHYWLTAWITPSRRKKKRLMDLSFCHCVDLFFSGVLTRSGSTLKCEESHFKFMSVVDFENQRRKVVGDGVCVCALLD